jgi:four helix bundle protein
MDNYTPASKSTPNETIVLKSYEFMKELVGVLKKFPRDQRFLLGDRIQLLASEIMETFIEAYYRPSSEKKPLLDKANILLEKMRYYLRMCYELGFYASTRYGQLSEQVQEIGRMNGGWIKSLVK